MNELKSAIKPGEGSTAPARIRLERLTAGGEWATWQENVTSGARFLGHYFCVLAHLGGEEGAYKRALKNYVKRCHELGVEPRLTEQQPTKETLMTDNAEAAQQPTCPGQHQEDQMKKPI